jgi:hypothetical protein
MTKERWIKISELEIEVEIKVHDRGKSWKELKLSKRETKLLTTEQCILLANNPIYSKILKMDGSSDTDDFFIQQPFSLSKKNKYVTELNINSVGISIYCYGNPSYHSNSLGVRFCRKIRKK